MCDVNTVESSMKSVASKERQHIEFMGVVARDEGGERVGGRVGV